MRVLFTREQISPGLSFDTIAALLPGWELATCPPGRVAEHGMMAREYPDVRANTVSSFALGDYEWMLAFEADELYRIVDLMRHLRGADARRHTRVEIPFYTGRRKPVAELVAALV